MARGSVYTFLIHGYLDRVDVHLDRSVSWNRGDATMHLSTQLSEFIMILSSFAVRCIRGVFLRSFYHIYPTLPFHNLRRS